MRKRDWRQSSTPLRIRCSGCDTVSAVSDREMYQLRYGEQINGWIFEEGKFTCPTCLTNGVPQGLLTIDRIGELLKEQWNLIYVKYQHHTEDTYIYEAAGLGTLQTLYFRVRRESSNVYKVELSNPGMREELGVLHTQKVS